MVVGMQQKVFKKIQLNTCAFLQPIKEHLKIKKILLDYIKTIKPNHSGSFDGNIYNTDFNNEATEKPYSKKIIDILTPYLNSITKELKAKELHITNFWFQQYNKGSYHAWHRHIKCNWTNVYYVEMPQNAPQLDLVDGYNKQIIKPFKVKEGDLLTFPSNIIHRSPINKGPMKTIISFNSDYEYIDKN